MLELVPLATWLLDQNPLERLLDLRISNFMEFIYLTHDVYQGQQYMRVL